MNKQKIIGAIAALKSAVKSGESWSKALEDASNEALSEARSSASIGASGPHVEGPECATKWIQDMKAAQGSYGRGAGGRELALAITNAEQAAMWFQRAVDLRRQEQETKDAAEVGGAVAT